MKGTPTHVRTERPSVSAGEHMGRGDVVRRMRPRNPVPLRTENLVKTKRVKGVSNLTEIIQAMTRPDSNGAPSLPKRGGPKDLLPSTWIERTLKVSYTDAYGAAQETSGTLLDLYPARS
jgi:hypothetical protein